VGAAGVDVAYQVTFDQDSGLVTVKCFKNRYSKEVTIVVRPELDDRGDFVVTQAPEIVATQDQVQILRRLIEQSPGLNQATIVAKCGLPNQRAMNLLRGHEGKEWRAEKGAHNARNYYPISSRVVVEI
jgi:hypothetical protein